MPDTQADGQTSHGTIAIWMIILLFCIVSDFVLAILVNESDLPISRAILVLPAAIILPTLTVVVSVIAYMTFSVQKGELGIFWLMLCNALGFLFASILWFALPTQGNFEPLVSIFGLILAFIGFMMAASGNPGFKIKFSREGRVIQAEVTLAHHD